MSDNIYFWVCLSDLLAVGTIGDSGGSPINWILRPDEEWLPEMYCKENAIEEVYLLLSTTEERAAILKDTLTIIGRRNLGRPIRTRTTKRLPGHNWRVIKES